MKQLSNLDSVCGGPIYNKGNVAAVQLVLSFVEALPATSNRERIQD